MPKQKRWTIKRELEQADGHLDLAVEQLVTTGYQYRGVHDDYYEAFTSLIAVLMMTKKSLNYLKDKI